MMVFFFPEYIRCLGDPIKLDFSAIWVGSLGGYVSMPLLVPITSRKKCLIVRCDGYSEKGAVSHFVVSQKKHLSYSSESNIA